MLTFRTNAPLLLVGPQQRSKVNMEKFKVTFYVWEQNDEMAHEMVCSWIEKGGETKTWKTILDNVEVEEE